MTDKALEIWNQRVAEYSKSYPGTKFARNLDTAKSRLAELGKMRAAIDASTTDSQKVMETMVSAVAGLLNVVDAIDEMTENGKIIHQANATVALMRRKEYTAQGRGWGTIGFGAGQFVPQMYQAFMRSQNLGDAYTTIFTRSATQAQIEFVNNTIDGAARDSVNKMRQAAALSPYKGNAGNVTTEQWLDATGKYIDSLKRAEERLLSDFAATVQERRFGGAVGILESAGALPRAADRHLRRGLVCRALHHASRRTIGRDDGDAGRGPSRHRGAGHRPRRRARAHGAGRAGVPRCGGREGASRSRNPPIRRKRRRSNASATRRRRAAAAAQVKHVVDALGEGLEQLAKGALTYRITEEFADEYKKVQDDFNAAISQLQETIGSIVTSTREVSNAAGEISSSTTDLSQRTEEQAASLEETSASMEEISATVKQNAENAQQANQFATGTREVGDRGGEVVAEAVKAMSRIEDSSRKISDIIGVIDEIARQTNLLALNAAVEAARAGEAGRGFAVVASEVRSLAQRSSQAAKDIKDLITNSSDQVQEGVELVNRAGTSLNEILASIKKVADIVSDIAAASAEQATGLEQVNKALSQMDEVTQQNSALVEENAATAKTLEHQAQCDGRAGGVLPHRRWRGGRGIAAHGGEGASATDCRRGVAGDACRRSEAAAGRGAQAGCRSEQGRRPGRPHAGRARHRDPRRSGVEGILVVLSAAHGAADRHQRR